MATDGIPVTFLDTHCDSFYFEEDNNGFESDAFRKSNEIWMYHIESTDSKLLTLTAEDSFHFENVAATSENEFSIQIYQNSAEEKKIGQAVMLYATKNNQKMVACCSQNSHQVHAAAMELPKQLQEEKVEVLFNMQGLSSTNRYMFESMLHRGWFLGFEHDQENPCRHKMVLIQREDQIDKSLHLLKEEVTK